MEWTCLVSQGDSLWWIKRKTQNTPQLQSPPPLSVSVIVSDCQIPSEAVVSRTYWKYKDAKCVSVFFPPEYFSMNFATKFPMKSSSWINRSIQWIKSDVCEQMSPRSLFKNDLFDSIVLKTTKIVLFNEKEFHKYVFLCLCYEILLKFDQ